MSTLSKEGHRIQACAGFQGAVPDGIDTSPDAPIKIIPSGKLRRVCLELVETGESPSLPETTIEAMLGWLEGQLLVRVLPSVSTPTMDWIPQQALPLS